MWTNWIIIIIILTLLELATTSLVSVWFIASAILSLAISFITNSFLIQFGIFVLGGLLFLVLTKPFIAKKFPKEKTKTNIDRVIGMTGKVTEPIEKNTIGEVYVDGKHWSAYADETIQKDELVKILSINGVKLQVRKEK